MSGTKKTVSKTPATKTPSKENVAANLKRWVSSQLTTIKKTILNTEQVKEIALGVVKEQASSPDTLKVWRVNVRWDLPSFGGIPMPPNTCFYGFATFDYTEIEAGAGIDFDNVLNMAMADHGALEQGLTVESFSLYA